MHVPLHRLGSTRRSVLADNSLFASKEGEEARPAAKGSSSMLHGCTLANAHRFIVISKTFFRTWLDPKHPTVRKHNYCIQ